MRIEEVQFYNWKQHQDLTLQLHGSTIGIIGNNGKGKSNFLVSIGDVITGNYTPKKDKCVTWGQKDGFGQVKLLLPSGQRLQIRRNIPSGKATLEVEGENSITGADNVNSRILELLQVDKSILENVVFVEQKSIEALLFADSSVRERLAAKFFGIETAQALEKSLGSVISGISYDSSANDLSNLESRQTELQGKLEQLNKQYQDKTSGVLEAEIETLQEEARQNTAAIQQHNSWVQLNDQSLKLTANLGVNHSEVIKNPSVDQLNCQIDALRKTSGDNVTLAARIKAHKALTQKADSLKASIDSLRQLLDQQKIGLGINKAAVAGINVAQINQMIHEHEAYEKRNDNITAAENNKTFLEGKLKELGLCPVNKEELDTLCVREKELESECIRNKQQQLTKDDELAGTGSLPCPKCGYVDQERIPRLKKELADLKTIFAKMRLTLAELSPKITNLQNKLNNWQNKKQSLDLNIEQANSALVTLGTRITANPQRYRDLLVRYNELNRIIESNEKDIINQEAQFKQIGSEFEANLKEQETYSGIRDAAGEYLTFRSSEEITAEIDNKIKIRDSQQKLEDKIKEIRFQITQNSNQLSGFSLKAQEPVEEIKDIPARLEQLRLRKKEQLDRETQINTLGVTLNEVGGQVEKARKAATENKVMQVYQESLEHIREVYHPEGAPKLLVTRKNKQMESRVNSYLQMLNVEFSAKVTDGLNFECHFPKGIADQSELSGGQRIALSWAYRLGACETFSSSVGLMTLDEPTVWLDAKTKACFNEIVERLKELSTQYGMQFLISTHDRNLIPYFDQVIEF